MRNELLDYCITSKHNCGLLVDRTVSEDSHFKSNFKEIFEELKRIVMNCRSSIWIGERPLYLLSSSIKYIFYNGRVCTDKRLVSADVLKCRSHLETNISYFNMYIMLKIKFGVSVPVRGETASIGGKADSLGSWNPKESIGSAFPP